MELVVTEQEAGKGDYGEKLLAEGTCMKMRLFDMEPKERKDIREGEGQQEEKEEPHQQPYETLGYVLAGRAKLELYLNEEGQAEQQQKGNKRSAPTTLELRPGMSWVVPAGAPHHYTVLEKFRAVKVRSKAPSPGQLAAPTLPDQ
ncbi:hypothetical protein QOT17_002980 [Balamuthia mandrillaris]